MSYTVEEDKLMDWSKGSLSMIRHFRAEIRLIEEAIKRGVDPLERLKVTRRWLNLCQQSHVGPFYTQEDLDRGEVIPKDPPDFP